MKAAQTFASRLPGRMEFHPAHEEVIRGDQELFRLHVEFAHAHGIPRGQFTTFSACVSAPNGARSK